MGSAIVGCDACLYLFTEGYKIFKILFCYNQYIVIDDSSFEPMVEPIVEFFKDYGYWGMGMLAFLSGTIVPVASEVLQVFFLGLGLNAVGITLAATLGNTLGGITCFLLGSLASKEWVLHFFNVPEKQIIRADAIIQKYGFLAAGLSFVPVIGDVLLIMLGIMRVGKTKVIVVMALGKLARYAFITASYFGIAELFGF